MRRFGRAMRGSYRCCRSRGVAGSFGARVRLQSRSVSAVRVDRDRNCYRPASMPSAKSLQPELNLPGNHQRIRRLFQTRDIHLIARSEKDTSPGNDGVFDQSQHSGMACRSVFARSVRSFGARTPEAEDHFDLTKQIWRGILIRRKARRKSRKRAGGLRFHRAVRLGFLLRGEPRA